MKNTLVAKSMIVSIVILCIGASSVSAYNIQSSLNPQPMDRGILYVGGAGPGNYTSIQEAIDNSSSGDTIFVFAGTYNENVDTKLKKVALIGEDRDTTIIQGQTTNPVVRIGNSDTSIEGFTMIGTSVEIILHVVTLCEDVFITNNVIKNGVQGISLAITTSRITITDNTIMDNVYIGIQVQSSTYDLIQGNTIKNNGAQGVDVSLNSNHNSILNNTITGNGEEGIAIGGLASTENTVQGNVISDNKIGVRFTGGAGSNEIRSNSIEGSAMEGLLLSSSNENTIEMNNFIGNKRQATFKISSRNVWDANYWSNWVGVKFSAPIFQKFPKVILGGVRMNFDKNPALEPYNISGAI
ncbi:MAG: pectinesterase family protein [Euryarchaeota archaeon]|nr:pectinesterase family protein [Euryarchaeota archaeon]